MKLNNKGWGLGYLIVVGTVIIIILIISSVKIRNFIRENQESNKKKQNDAVDTIKTDNNAIFTALELRLEEAGESYTVYHETLIDNTEDYLIVSYDELKEEGHISSLPDPDGDKSCDGYVMIKPDFSVKPFLSCTNYKTLDYDLWVE